MRRRAVRSGIQDPPQPAADAGTSVCVCVCVPPFCLCVRRRVEERDVARMLRIRFLKLAGFKITIGRQQNVAANILQRELGSGACTSVCRRKFGPLLALLLLLYILYLTLHPRF